MLAKLQFSLLSFRLQSGNLTVKIDKTILLLLVLYACETWALTLRKEHTLRVCGKRGLSIFGNDRDDIMWEWRMLHNEELQNLYSSPDIIMQVKSRRIRWTGHVAHGNHTSHC
jgi:hypothetical protein